METKELQKNRIEPVRTGSNRYSVQLINTPDKYASFDLILKKNHPELHVL